MGAGTERVTAPYGSWPSAFPAALVAAESMRLNFPRGDGDDVYWVEGRASEAGRVVLVRARDADVADVTRHPFSVRTRVHEYGGLAYAVHDGVIVFANFPDQRLYRLAGDGDAEPEPITPEPPTTQGVRYADLAFTPAGGAVVAVRESHTPDGVANELVMLMLDGTTERVLVRGHDFFAFPRVSPDGRQLAWISWDHPQMPWDGTELWVASFDDRGNVGSPTKVAGATDTSVFQPEWSPTGVLHFISDRSGWWNLYRRDNDGAITAIAPRAAEFGVPLWLLGSTTYAFLADGRLVALWGEDGRGRLGVFERDGELREIDQPFTSLSNIVAAGDRVVLMGAGGSTPASVVVLEPDSGTTTVLRQATDIAIDPATVSCAEHITFPTSRGRTAHAYFYEPVNPAVVAPAGEQPPLVVMSHGGPTSAASSALDLGVQFWTSRGFAVVDVNYGGSTGYGRTYRRALNEEWGIVDVDDCIAAAHHLADTGRVDRRRMVIRGGSAGGWTTLCALTFHDEFAAGANYFGVADAETFVTDTHKFEARYIDSLIGPWPETAERYRERSPINFVDRLSRPLIVFQGLDDVIVPPSQSEMIVDALRAKHVPVAYLPFAGEDHGFRQAATITRAYEAELSFYAQVLGFEPADAMTPVVIENLAPAR